MEGHALCQHDVHSYISVALNKRFNISDFKYEEDTQK